LKKIGILGGTFDPVHVGHLMLADQAASALGLSRVLFVPTGRPPHKDSRRITPAEHRIGMVRLAIEGNGLFEATTVECDYPGTSYTYITLGELRAQYGPDVEFYYIIGSDVLAYITKFINYRQVFDSCVFAVSARPGADRDRTEMLARELVESYGARIRLVGFPEIAISSSMLREKIARGESVRYMAPDAVIKYINEHNLYKDGGDTALPGYWDSIPPPAARGAPIETGDAGGASNADNAENFDYAAQIEKIRKIVKSRLRGKRFAHTLGVTEVARGLAEDLGADPDKAALAGLLHDCMRERTNDELAAYCEENGVPASDAEKMSPAVLHARAGAREAEALLGYADHEIEEAIACHTTGREGMGLLAKIIFAADAVEPGREYEASKKARAMLGISSGARNKKQTEKKHGAVAGNTRALDDAILFILENQIKHIVDTGLPLHPDTVLARNWMLREANDL